jgi:hypothetical protein
MIRSFPSWIGEETLIKGADYADLGSQILLGTNNFPRQISITARFA